MIKRCMGMEERQVTIDGETRAVGDPFFVIATQNPVKTAGTFPSPEAQLDRFLMQIFMGLPDDQEELCILERFIRQSPLEEVKPVLSLKELRGLQKSCKDVYVHTSLMEYIVALVQATREGAEVLMGVTVTSLEMRRSISRIRTNGRYIPAGNLEHSCQEALDQIKQKRYDGQLFKDGMRKVLKYGVACCRKRCRIMLEKEK